MGGINCGGGGGGGGNIAPEFSAEYVEQLASYCKSLFDGSAKFFEANVAIEDAVMTGGDLVAAMQLLSSSEDALTSARATLGTVAALWSSVRTPKVDFGEQQKLISDAVNKAKYSTMPRILLETSVIKLIVGESSEIRVEPRVINSRISTGTTARQDARRASRSTGARR